VPELIVATDALSTGRFTRRELMRRCDRVYRNVYVAKGATLTACDRAVAAWLSSGRQATMAGMSAAALLGSRWVPADAPAEFLGTHHRAPVGIVAHSGRVPADEIRLVTGIRCTTAERTAYDLGRRLPFVEGLIRVDALMNATGIGVEAIAAIAERYPGARRVRRLRRVLDLADGGAESPQETRVRLLLIRGGLPRPVTQIQVGRRRVDMGWPQWKVGVEYDGVQHWEDPRQHRGDVERLEFFAASGWRIVRVVADHVRREQHGSNEIVVRAEKALSDAGWRREAPF
jgi:very-short-patch-repair endonuclease